MHACLCVCVCVCVYACMHSSVCVCTRHACMEFEQQFTVSLIKQSNAYCKSCFSWQIFHSGLLVILTCSLEMEKIPKKGGFIAAEGTPPPWAGGWEVLGKYFVKHKLVRAQSIAYRQVCPQASLQLASFCLKHRSSFKTSLGTRLSYNM